MIYNIVLQPTIDGILRNTEKCVCGGGGDENLEFLIKVIMVEKRPVHKAVKLN